MQRPRPRSAARLLLLGLLIALLAVPAQGEPKTRPVVERGQSRMSQAVLAQHWIEQPDRAPEVLRDRFQALHDRLNRAGAASRSRAQAAPGGPAILADRFNRDVDGLPQNEESVTACRGRPNVVLGGTNDYRGLLDPLGNFTGWHLSLDGGRNLRNEGLLPAIEVEGFDIPSGGDPVDVAGAGCSLYAGSLNFTVVEDPPGEFREISAIGAYRSDPATLAGCAGGASPSCWPTRRAVAVAEPGHFLDKEWIDVGPSGPAGQVLWAAYTDFDFSGAEFAASIRAVRCTADLSACTEPILVSGDDRDVQFADVTVGPDGRTYISWVEILTDEQTFVQTFVVKLRVAQPGSTSFGPERVVATEAQPIPFGGFLQANDFRVATYPKHEVRIVNGRPWVFVVWDRCRARVLGGFICELPEIRMRSSDDLGASWSGTRVLSAGGVNYFPAISSDRAGPRLAVAWFTNRFDPAFHNRQDVELVSVDPTTGQVTRRQRVTRPSNESEADPALGGFFIGDYIEVFAHRGTALVHYNANYRKQPTIGEGFAVNQQDNYLSRRGL
jgi:hypothetical protein